MATPSFRGFDRLQVFLVEFPALLPTWQLFVDNGTDLRIKVLIDADDLPF